MKRSPPGRRLLSRASSRVCGRGLKIEVDALLGRITVLAPPALVRDRDMGVMGIQRVLDECVGVAALYELRAGVPFVFMIVMVRWGDSGVLSVKVSSCGVFRGQDEEYLWAGGFESNG